MDGVNKAHFSILTGITLSVLILGLSGSPQNAYAGVTLNCESTQTGFWDVSSTWTNCDGGVPGDGDSATIKNGHTVTIRTDLVTSGNTLSGLSLTVEQSAELVLDGPSGGQLEISGGTFTNLGKTTLDGVGATVAEANLVLSGSSSGINECGGTIDVNGGSSSTSGRLHVNDSIFINKGNINLNGGDGVNSGSLAVFNNAQLDNHGTINENPGAAANSGIVDVRAGTFNDNLPNLCVASSGMFMESSGTVNEGGLDPRITYQQGPFATGFEFPIEDVCNNVGGDFPSGGNAFIVPRFLADPDIEAQKDWKAHLDIDPTAEYVSNSATGNEIGGGARTALFTHTFDAGTVIAPLDEAFLIFHYLSDNDLGVDPENVGLLLNCVSIPASSMISDGLDLPNGDKPFFSTDQTEGLFDVSDLLLPGENTLSVYLRNWGGPAGIQYKFAFSFDQCPSGATPEPIPEPEPSSVTTQEHGFECVGTATTSGAAGHEPPTIGKSLDGVRQVVDGGMSVDDQTWTVTQGYHQEFELLQMLTSPHTISNIIHCSKGVQYCNYIAVGFMGLTDDFNNPVMTVSASKDHLGDWTLDWYDPDDYISDPSDATPADIVFVPQIIDDKLLGTSFTIDFKNKDTGQLKLGIQVRDSYLGVRNFFFNEGVEFIDADAYPAVETAYDAPVEVESVCFGQNNPDRNSCQFSKIKDWTTQNAEETLRQMMGNQYQYDQ